MTRYVVFVAMLVSIAVIRNRGVEAAFLRVWIPCFLLFPFAFFVNIPGLPDPNFMQAAILPIIVGFFMERRGRIKIGTMEVLIVTYFVLRVGMDFISRGYADAQNYAFFLFSSLFGPYLLGRYLIDRREMDVLTARQFGLVMICLFPMFVYEMRFWISPVYKVLLPFFPYATPAMSQRYGLPRTFGPFEHPILACVMIVAVYRLHRWLCWSGEWDKPQTGWLGKLHEWTHWMRIPLKHKISIVLLTMAAMTISRGPWIGGFAGAALAGVGNFKNRRRWLVILCLLLAVGGVGGKLALDIYTTPRLGEAMSYEARTMLYRKELVERYKAFLLEKLWTGWGLTTRPKIPGMESVDNAFLGMALAHGILAPLLIIVIFVYATATQIHFGIRAPPGAPPIGFTFAGIYLAAFISFATVYMGAQTEPMLFLLLGWGESIKNRPERALAAGAAERAPSIGAAFRRVLY